MNVVVLSSFNRRSIPRVLTSGIDCGQAVNQYPSGKGAAPLTQLRCSLRFAAHGAAPVATGGSRLLVEQPHAGAWGLGARRHVALYGGACYDRTWRSSRPCYARRLNFHVRLVCAHSPNSPAGVASTPFWGGGGWGGTSASPYWAKSASAWSYFAQSPLLAVASLPALHRWLALLLRVLCASLC